MATPGRLRAAVQAFAAKGPGKGFGAWPTALPAAEEGLRPDPLTSPSKPIRKNWETALNVATPVPGPASAGLWSLANGPAGCRGGFETGPPNVTFETHKKELGDSSQRGHARPGFGSQGCGASICSQRSREGLWSLANAAEEGLRPDPLTSPSKHIRKKWETALNVATPGPASGCGAGICAPERALQPGQRPCRLPRRVCPNVTFEAHKKELGDSSQRGHARARPGFGSQGCGASICSQRSREGLWSLANGPAGCRGGFETGTP